MLAVTLTYTYITLTYLLEDGGRGVVCVCYDGKRHRACRIYMYTCSVHSICRVTALMLDALQRRFDFCCCLNSYEVVPQQSDGAENLYDCTCAA